MLAKARAASKYRTDGLMLTKRIPVYDISPQDIYESENKHDDDGQPAQPPRAFVRRSYEKKMVRGEKNKTEKEKHVFAASTIAEDHVIVNRTKCCA